LLVLKYILILSFITMSDQVMIFLVCIDAKVAYSLSHKH
jgi:hypothetical protein